MTRREQAVALVNELVNAVNAHDADRVMRLYAEDAVTVSPVTGTITGLNAIRQSWTELFTSFSDVTADLSDMLVDDDRIVILGTSGFTDDRGWYGQPEVKR